MTWPKSFDRKWAEATRAVHPTEAQTIIATDAHKMAVQSVTTAARLATFHRPDAKDWYKTVTHVCRLPRDDRRHNLARECMVINTNASYLKPRVHEFKLDRVSFQREGRKPSGTLKSEQPPTTPIGKTTEHALYSQSHQTTSRMGPQTDETIIPNSFADQTGRRRGDPTDDIRPAKSLRLRELIRRQKEGPQPPPSLMSRTTDMDLPPKQPETGERKHKKPRTPKPQQIADDEPRINTITTPENPEALTDTRDSATSCDARQEVQKPLAEVGEPPAVNRREEVIPQEVQEENSDR